MSLTGASNEPGNNSSCLAEVYNLLSPNGVGWQELLPFIIKTMALNDKRRLIQVPFDERLSLVRKDVESQEGVC